jgi:hypothetical protein
MQADGSRIRALNGSFTPNLDYDTGAYLRAAAGMQIVGLGPADRAYDQTDGNPVFAEALYSKVSMGFVEAEFEYTDPISPDPASQVDVEVRLGTDWANSNSLP